MKPYVITDKSTREVLKECEDFSQGWEDIQNMKDCELIRTSDSVVLAQKGRLIDETVPFIIFQAMSSPFSKK